MVTCIIADCKNRSSAKSTAQVKREAIKGKISFHAFPKDAEMRKRWLNMLGIDEINLKKCAVICSEHFEEKAINKTSSSSVRIRSGSLPKKHSSHNQIQEENKEKMEISNNSTHDFEFVVCSEEVDTNDYYLSMSPAALDTTTLQEIDKPTNMSPDDMEVMEILKNPKPNKYVLMSAVVRESTEKLQMIDKSTSMSPELKEEKSKVDASTCLSPARIFNSPRSMRLCELLKEREKKYKYEMLLLKKKYERQTRKSESLENMLRNYINKLGRLQPGKEKE